MRGFNNNKTQAKAMSFWPIVLLLLFLGAGILGYLHFTNTKKPEYINKQEFYQKNLVKILDKMLGKHNYIVNVSFQYSGTQRQLSSVQYEPREITERYQNNSLENKKEESQIDAALELQSNKNYEGKDYLTDKKYKHEKPEPGAIAPKEEAIETNQKTDLKIEKLPGLAPRTNKGYKDNLPGFPKIGVNSAESKRLPPSIVPPVIQENSIATSLPLHDISQKEGTTAEGLKNIQSNKNRNLKTEDLESKQDQVYVKQLINENKETIIIPDSKIDRIYISLVLNKDQLKELAISQAEVAGVVKTVVGFEEERGDSLYLSVYSFKGFFYTLRKNALIFFEFIKNYKWLFTVAFTIPIFLFILYLLGRVILNIQSEKSRNAEFQKQAVEVKEEKEIQGKVEKQNDEIISLAKNRPEEFAKALIDWIEKIIHTRT